VIEIKGVSKSFGDIIANDNISLQIMESEIVGLIGPDGAGKTTLMRQLCALSHPDQGNIHIDAYDTVKNQYEVRSMIGYMPQRFSLYPDLTIEQNLLFFANLFNTPKKGRQERLEQLYKFSNLKPFQNRQAGKLSGGMKQKLALSCNLIHTPKYLFLDEPTFGVDPVSRQEFWELIKQLRDEGLTVFVSTPYLDEANTFDKLALIFNGKILAYKTPEKIVDSYSDQIFVMQSENYDYFAKMQNVKYLYLFNKELYISFSEAPRQEEWQTWLDNKVINGYNQKQITLEDVFLMQNKHIVSQI
jgi:ABC-2 type transport system ATP-binding protein